MLNQQLVPMPCFMVNNLTSNSLEQCKFILDNDCLEEDAAIDYVHLVYCEFGHELRYVSIILIVFLVVVLFLALSSIADEFLCPSLLAVAKNLRMSDSLAGVTLLAFGNGCPDIFSSIAAASDDRPELIVGELLGAGIFCTSIVSGLIFIHSDFKLACRPLLRDTTFYLFAVYLMWSYCWDQQITFYRSLAFILIYVIYLVVALTGQAIYSRALGEYPIADTHLATSGAQLGEKQENWFRARNKSLRLKQVKQVFEESIQIKPNSNNIQASRAYLNYNSTDNNSSQLDTQIVAVTKKKPPAEGINDWKQPISPLVHHLELIKQPVMKLKQTGSDSCLEELIIPTEWDLLLEHVNPIKTDEWAEMSLIAKLCSILNAPLLFVALLTVPVVDAERKSSNWCRPLNVLHCVTVPLAISSLFKTAAGDYVSLFGVPLPLLLLAPACCLAAFVFRTSSPCSAPNYHSAFAYFGFVMSVVWIYTLASEIISLLKTIGIMFSMSDTAIGLGVLAWGNSLGDIVANLSLAEAGYPRMAIGAAIGAPLLNLLLGFGISLSLNLKPGQSLSIEYSPTITLLCSTLGIILLSLMLSTLAPADRSKKPFGYLLIGCYCVYFIIAICLEYNFIQLN